MGLTSTFRRAAVLAALSLAACTRTPPYALTRQDCDDIVSSVDAGRGRLVAYDLGVMAGVLDRLGIDAFDPQSATGVFDRESALASLGAWREFRDRAVFDR